MIHVIHFADFEDMIAELDPEEKVRIARLKSIEGQDRSGVMYEVIGVHVRQIQDNRILSWMYPAGRYRTSRNVPLEAEDEENMKEGWERAKEVSDLAANRLLDKDTFRIRPGIIDLDGRPPLAGYWSMIDDEPEEEEPEIQPE